MLRYGTLPAAPLLAPLLAPLMATLLATSAPAQAASVGLGWSPYYTPTLADNLTARGDSVSVVRDYDAHTLSAFDVFILDGQTRANAQDLDAFVHGGGTLILQPLSMAYAGIAPAMSVVGEYHHADAGQALPAITALAPNDWLLQGVTLPAAGEGTIAREFGTQFAEGAIKVLEWEDGDALLGYRQYGAGTVIAFNVNLVMQTADPLDAAWSNRIVYNAIDAAVSPVPEPATYAMLGTGLLALFLRRHRVGPASTRQ